MDKYNHKDIEKKWQDKWRSSGIYKNYNKEKKFYALDMFPYPSGAGLHVGHPKGYIATDVYSRFMMLQGYSVIHPMGWDAFGLPAENYAIANKIHPKIAVEKNIATFKGQLQKFGFTYDWDREINTTDPEYYKWTQWIFLKMFEKGLAYESHEPINWCPKCKTGLANEDLENGLCERCGTQVEQKKMRQWVLKMTDYADRLLEDLDKEGLDWEDSILDQQKNWIGRSEGTQFEMKIANSDEKIEVYTTRVDTSFGMTYAVIAPEHKLIEELGDKIKNLDEVKAYAENAKKKTDLERTELQKEKTGVELKGIKVINPFNNEEIPLFAADYVLGHYGTGAVMAVPAHDERDYDFAVKNNLTIRQSIAPHYIDHNNPPVAGKKVVGRKAVQCVVKHWSDNKVITLRWKQHDWRTFIIGGVEGDEDLADTARREIREETGYKNIKFIKKINGEFHSEYFAAHKDENRYGYFQGMFFELENGEQEEISAEEAEKHEVVWTDFNEVEGALTSEDIKAMWRGLMSGDSAFTEDGCLVDSGEFTGLTSGEAREKMTEWLEKKGIGKKKINYKMRDWVFSRQRYWGEPIPIIHCEKCGAVGVPEKDLPVELPEVESYEPTGTGEGPLASIETWVNTECPKCKGPAKRETNTMPQWAGSSWYYLRYIDNKNDEELVGKKEEKEWMPVDLYVGGAEHATRHLLYARFWHKFLYDIKAVSTKEPFKRLVHVGLINAEDGRKMSKRWNNVINPDDIIEQYGADSIRLYEMFMGPFTQNIAWSTEGVRGVRRFLDKTWDYFNYYKKYKTEPGYRNKLTKEKEESCLKEISPLLNKTIKKVTENIENFRFNTAISQMMILLNELRKERIGDKNSAGYNFFNERDMEKILILLSPFAPHITEELWEQLGHKESIFKEEWPKHDENLIKDETINLVVQVNSKVRDTIAAPADISEEEAKKLALASEKVKKWIGDNKIKKIIFIKGRLVNIVV